jgi:trans-aconitate methyltransferase
LIFFEESHANKYLAKDDESQVDSRLTEIEIAHILNELSLAPPFLDLGFGHGAVADAIIKKFGECSVVEASPRLVQQARSRFDGKITVYPGYFEEVELSATFSTIFATGVLHHVSEPVNVLERIVRFLSPGGKIIVSVPNGHSIHRALGVIFGIQDSLLSQTATGAKSGVSRVMAPNDLHEVISKAGLHVTSYVSSYVKILSNAQMSSFSREQLELLFQVARTTPTELHANLIFVCEKRA